MLKLKYLQSLPKCLSLHFQNSEPITFAETINKLQPSPSPVQTGSNAIRGAVVVFGVVCAPLRDSPPLRKLNCLYTCPPQPRPTPSRHMCLHSNTPTPSLRFSLTRIKVRWGQSLGGWSWHCNMVPVYMYTGSHMPINVALTLIVLNSTM